MSWKTAGLSEALDRVSSTLKHSARAEFSTNPKPPHPASTTCRRTQGSSKHSSDRDSRRKTLAGANRITMQSGTRVPDNSSLVAGNATLVA